MSISSGPPAPPKKSGMGCLGCGCLILALIAILILGLLGAVVYAFYVEIDAVTSKTPATIPTFTGSDDVYQGALRKLADFDHDLKNHQAATIRLSADEVNALIAHNPDFIRNNEHAYVAFANTGVDLQASLPTDRISRGYLTGRYLNFDSTFTVAFDRSTRSVVLTPQSLQLGSVPVLGPNVRSNNEASAATVRQSLLPPINQMINDGIRRTPDGPALLDQAKSVEIQDGELIIETQ